MKNTLYICMLLVLFSCKENKPATTEKEIAKTDSSLLVVDSIFEVVEKHIELIANDNALEEMTALETQLIDQGLVDITDIDSTIMVDIKYSTTDNFMQLDMYGDFDKAYLQKDVAQKLANAQRFLKMTNPELSLLVFDAVRPRHVQQQMWDSLKMPINEKVKFVSNPKYGSLHNFGAAVDVTLAKRNGEALDMGTPYDYIGALAYPTLETQNLKAGKLTQEQINNRKLLRKVMYKADFFNIQTEWWHFNSCNRTEARKLYEIVE